MSGMSEKLSNGDSASFWAAAAEGRLVFQKCGECGHVQFPPRHMCAKCWSASVADVPSTGEGVIESVTVVRRAPVAAFRNEVPYVVVSVILDDGPRMITNLLGDDALDAAIGDRVAVTFAENAVGNVLPQFRRSA